MTDAERIAKMTDKKNRILAEIFGNDSTSVPVSPEVEKRVVDKNWNSGKSWMDQIRITIPMNNDMQYVGYYNDLIHKNNGVMVTVVDSFKAGFAAPPVK